jgi:hypothetical protein
VVGGAAFSHCRDIGVDKKTLHCVDKIHFRLFRPPFFSGGVWTSAGLGSIVTHAPSASAAPRKIQATPVRTL